MVTERADQWFLAAGVLVVWLGFALYMWRLFRLQRALDERLARLGGKAPPTGPPQG